MSEQSGANSLSLPRSFGSFPGENVSVVQEDHVGPLVHEGEQGLHVVPHKVVRLGPEQRYVILFKILVRIVNDYADTVTALSTTTRTRNF